MPKFLASKINMVRTSTSNLVAIDWSGNTKRWYADVYFDGIDNINNQFLTLPEINPLGTDFNVRIVVSNPSVVYGKEYKKIKYFVSNMYFDTYLSKKLDNVDKLSFWFVDSSTTIWVKGVPKVIFNLKLDIVTTFIEEIEKLQGSFYFKRKHFDRWIRSENGNYYLPNFKNAPSIGNCSAYCAKKNTKVMRQIWPENNQETYTYAVIYYNIGHSEDISGHPELTRNTIIEYNTNDRLSIPYGMMFILYPENTINDATWPGNNDTILNYVINEFQKLELGTIVNVCYTSLAYNLYDSAYVNDWYKLFNDQALSPNFNKQNSTTTNANQILQLDKLNYDLYYGSKDYLYNDLNTLTGDSILPENEPHLGMMVHRELIFASPDKNLQSIDLGLLFRNGDALTIYNNEPKLKVSWYPWFSPEASGKIGYINNTASDLTASIFTSRNFIDFIGSENYPFKTDAYLEQMITQKNQKQASYDNVDIENQTAKADAGMDFSKSSLRVANQAVDDVADGIGSTGLFNWGGAAAGGIKAASDAAFGMAINGIQLGEDIYNANQTTKMEKNSLDAQYADLANSPGNIHATGKVSTQTQMFKTMITNVDNILVEPLKVLTFKNEIQDIEKDLIAFDLNKYGYTCDWISPNQTLSSLSTRRFWNYCEIINIEEILLNSDLQNDIIKAIATIFKSGVFFINIDMNNKNPIFIDWNQNNFENNYFNDYEIDIIFDNILID